LNSRILVGISRHVSGVMFPSCSAAAEVMSLNVDPGVSGSSAWFRSGFRSSSATRRSYSSTLRSG
jgi:hypothetical protein